MNRHIDTVCDVYVHDQRPAADGLSVQTDSKESGTAENTPKFDRAISQSRLKEVLDYNEFTGEFKWLKSLNSRCQVGAVAGSICRNGYVLIGIDGYTYSAHRLAFLFMTGKIPEIIDHVNGVKSCNRWNNLRRALQSENRLNSRVMSNNVLGIKGICWVESRHRYKACITINNSKNRVRKYFKELEEAVKWLNEMRLIHHKGFANNG